MPSVPDLELYETCMPYKKTKNLVLICVFSSNVYKFLNQLVNNHTLNLNACDDKFVTPANEA